MRAAIGMRSGSTMPALTRRERDLERLIELFSDRTNCLRKSSDDDVAKLVAWRRGHRVTRHGKGKKNARTAHRAGDRQPQHHGGAEEAIHPRQGMGHPIRPRAGLEAALAEGTTGARAGAAWRRG